MRRMSKQLRWQVFTRDSFTCRYCGRSPVTHPGTVLEVDHKHPVSLGGTDDIDNLLTACEPCNRGKLAQPLGEFDIPAVPPIAPVIRRSVSTVLSGTLGILSVFDSPIPSIKIYSRHAPRCPNKGGGERIRL
jgi:5-methylcytosine-specific restriction endonuclease McrA